MNDEVTVKMTKEELRKLTTVLCMFIVSMPSASSVYGSIADKLITEYNKQFEVAE